MLSSKIINLLLESLRFGTLRVNLSQTPFVKNVMKQREDSDAILPDRSVQRDSVASLETARSLG